MIGIVCKVVGGLELDKVELGRESEYCQVTCAGQWHAYELLTLITQSGKISRCYNSQHLGQLVESRSAVLQL